MRFKRNDVVEEADATLASWMILRYYYHRRRLKGVAIAAGSATLRVPVDVVGGEERVLF